MEALLLYTNNEANDPIVPTDHSKQDVQTSVGKKRQ